MKELLNARAIREIGRAFSRVHPAFAEDAFVKEVVRGLGALELKARVKLVAEALRVHLPKDLRQAYPLLTAVVASAKNPEGLQGFVAWPLAQFVEDFGLDQPTLSLETLARITAAMSAEFAVRPYLIQHQDLALRTMLAWAESSDEHLRRLASEGSRPRLPWGQRLEAFQKNPSFTAPILRKLRQDPSLYVRKSVANHLNDISKDHPAWLLDELRRWKEELPGDSRVEWILRHACRSLVKEGNKEALSLLGFGKAAFERARVQVSPARIRLGQSVTISFQAKARAAGPWMVDYAVHHLRSKGKSTPKVFKWKKLRVQKGELVRIERNHALKKISTRRYYAGVQRVEIFVNGISAGSAGFTLTL